MRFFGILTYIAAKSPRWFDFGSTPGFFCLIGRTEFGSAGNDTVPVPLSAPVHYFGKNVFVSDIRRKT